MNISNFKIVATMGHIKDLPKNKFGITIQDNQVKPLFVFLPYKKKIIENISKSIDKYQTIILATDPDREGEAISFHVYNEISKIVPPNKKTIFKRAFINEITVEGLKKALSNLKFINFSMVESQITRRVIDRIIGYKISPFLWRKFSIKGLSAGRVQSATARLIYLREKEIENFKPQKYYIFSVKIKIGNDIFKAFIYKGSDIFKLFNNDEVEKFRIDILDKLKGRRLKFNMKIEQKELIPPDPLKTSTLQQEAAKMGISNEETMKIAQKLYEGVLIEKEKMGLITYHRTDSIRISSYGIQLARKIIPEVVVYNRKNKTMFDAHEAIRITSDIPIATIKKFLLPNEFKIYELIYNRFLASLSPPCSYLHQKMVIKINELFHLEYESGKIIKNGFLDFLPSFIDRFRIFKNKFIESNENFAEIISYEILEEYTKPPARYTLSSIIKKMEEVGIGRPSTYSTTIQILKKRKYIQVRNGSIYMTELGKKVIEFLFEKYPHLLDVDFTSHLEDFLDKIENDNYQKAKELSLNKILEIYNMLK